MDHAPSLDDTDRERAELELLVARCQLGEAAAFDALVARWHEPLWRYLRGATGDPEVAREVLQESWVRILRGIDRLRDASRLRPWLFSIARRAFMDRLRVRYAHEGHEPLGDEPADDSLPAELAWEDAERLHAALDRLSPPDRETTVLFYLRELDLQEVADVLAVPVGTVKSRLHRARRFLRAQLTAQGGSR